MKGVIDVDNQHLTKYTPQLVGNTYYKLDTTTDPTKTALIPAMNGRQEDRLRSVPIAFVDDDNPHDLTNTKIMLKVLDADGVVKVADKIVNLVDPQGGLVVFGVPGEVYEAVGEVQRAYFVLQEPSLDGEEQSISTINVDFTVDRSIDISKKQSSIYISSLDKVLSKGGSYAVTNADNHFIGSNSIDDLTVGSLHNASLADVQASVQSQTSAIATNSTAISDVKSSVTALSTTISTAQSNLPAQVTSLANSAVAGFDKRLSNVEASAENASATASAVMQLLPSKANQSSLDSLSTDVDNLWDEANSNSNAINSMQSAVNNASRVAQSMATVPDSVNTLDQRVNSLSQSIPWNLASTITSMERAISSLENRSN